MGDSNACMYGTAVRDICADIQCELAVASVDAGDPLPDTIGKGKLWLSSLDVVRQAKPDVVILGAYWTSKLSTDMSPLNQALDSLRGCSRRIILLDDPPVAPAKATRSAMGAGSRPPFREAVEVSLRRRAMTSRLQAMTSSSVAILPVAEYFENSDGTLAMLFPNGRLTYHDDNHLSDDRVKLIKPAIRQLLQMPLPPARSGQN